MKTLLQKIRRILRDRKTRRLLTRVISTIAAVVVFATTYALVLPAITMESVAECGIEEHQHDDSCFEEVLVCDIPESPGHQHTDACYEVSQVLVCEKEEHIHSEEAGCYDENGNLICGLEEHSHSVEQGCYEEVRDLVCGQEESEGHTHDSSCYEKVLVCGKEAHIHSQACYHNNSTGEAAAESAAVASTASTISAGAEFDQGKSYDGGNDADDLLTDAVSMDDEASVAASTGIAAEAMENTGYVPVLDALNFDRVLNGHTGIYYYHPDLNEESAAAAVGSDTSVIDSAMIAPEDWHRIQGNTKNGETPELGKNDILRVYLSYSIPAGSLNSTNPVARYRLPGNLHLTDNQVRAINETVNGIAGSYVNMDTLEILDPASYQKYLGIEAAEGTRTPDQDVNDYLADLSRKSGTEANEYISATVKVENIYDDSSNRFGEPLAQDLIITFTPYSIEENQHTYDSTGTPTRAGTDIEGWLALDFHLSQVDWNESAVDIYEREVESEIEGDNEGQNEIDIEGKNEADSADENEADNEDVNEVHNEGVNENAASVETVERCEKTADIVFVAEGRDEQGNKIREISTSLKLVEETVIETSAADPHTASGTPGDQENTENTAGDDVANDANNDRTAEAADATDDSAEGQKPVDDSDEDQNKSEEDPYTDGTLTAEGDGYAITLTYTADAKIPADAKLNVTEITEESDPEAYAACLEQAEASVNADKAASASDTSDGTEGFEAGRKVDKKATRFFDIEIRTTTVDENGQEKTDKIEPAAPVAVNIQLEDNTGTSSDPASESAVGSGAAANDEQTSQNPAPTVIHFAEEGVEKLDSTIVAPTTDSATDSTADPTVESTADPTSGSTARENDGRSDTKQPVTEVQFQAESFSIYGVVYTVDFHYAANGKMYDFSIPGGGFVSLEHLVEVLGIGGSGAYSENRAESAEKGSENAVYNAGEESDIEGTTTYSAAVLNTLEISEETMQFVTDVESVEFSSPELVWVGKVDSDSTVGGLKEANGLECEYSSDLTEEQINEINGSTVEAGDWALISVRPFTSEETLTVTMTNGDQWTVKVTDGQIEQASELTVGEEYILYIISADGSYYALKDDGSTNYVDNKDLDGLDSHYRWVYTENNEHTGAIWTCNGYKVNPYLVLNYWYDYFWGDATIYNPAWTPISRLISLADGGFKFEDLNNPDRYLAYYSHNSGSDIIRTKWDYGKNDVISIHIYKPGTAYTVQLQSGNDEYGFVRYTLDNSTQSTSADVQSITVNTEKVEDENKSVPGSITAVPAEGFKFTGWTVLQVNDWDNYQVTDWGTDSSELSESITPTVDGNIILQANFAPEKQYRFTVKTMNDAMGVVAGNDANGTSVDNQSSFESISTAVISNTALNMYQISASTKPKYKFTGWELRDGNTVIWRSSDTEITAESIPLTKDNLELVATFAEKELSEITDQDIDEFLSDWKTNMTKNLTGVDKTASVFDYENRIYKINMQASSQKYVSKDNQDIALSFITDTSRSMFFPANLTVADNTDTNKITSLSSWLTNKSHDNVYFMISGDSTATMYAIYYNDGWKYMDSSYKFKDDDVGGNEYSVPNSLTVSNNNGTSTKTLTGIVYTTSNKETTQYWSRLDYLFKAVETATETLYAIDDGAKIGITTFNSEPEYKGVFGKTSTEIENLLRTITMGSGTRQDLGLSKAAESGFYTNGSAMKQVAMLITDGAPNGSATWPDNIVPAADTLKGFSDTKGNALTLMTLGLSLDYVGGTNKQYMHDIASAPQDTNAQNADSGPEIVDAIEKLVESLVVKANFFGTASDELDPAFYPVKADGTPIEADKYYDMDGNLIGDGTTEPSGYTEYCKWTKNGEVWTITYYNQTFEWPTLDSAGNIIKAGWERAFYIKAKEDFLGGNTTETNGSASVTANESIIQGTTTHVTLKKDNEAAPITKAVDSPHVNVKQLTLEGNDTKWTVYTETTVYPPIDQMKELFNHIKVLEVVDNSTDHMITSNTAMLFTPGEGTEPETFLLKDVITVTDSDWEDLQGINGGDGTVDITYTAYGHTPGVIRLTLTKSGDTADYEEHVTDSSPNAVEKYVLTAQYIPYTVAEMQAKDSDGGAYHTTFGELAGSEIGNGRPCDNTHTIDLFTRGISITKTDETFKNALSGAEFMVYRPATDEEIASTDPDVQEKIKTFEGDSAKYYADHMLDFDDSGVSFKNAVKAYGDTTKYYLVETKAPNGYVVLKDPIPVMLTISSTYTVMPVEEGSTPETQETKPATGLFNWEQKAKLEITASSGYLRTTGAYDPEDSTTDLTHTGIESTSLYEVMYYRIANNPGVALPATGGPGTNPIYLIGLMLMAFAGTGIVMKQRRRNAA